jgi:hypothetical protein
MPPQIAILGWGSLLWEGGADLDRWHDDWRDDGPSLKLEFSRVSSTRLGALTLVLDSKHGTHTTVAWCMSKRKEPADAVADLRCREGCGIGSIARLDLPLPETSPPQYQEAATVAEWASTRELDVVVWTALQSNFETKVGKPFSVEEAVAYVKGLSPEAKVRAAEYVWRAPRFVNTPMRKALERPPWFS